MQELGALYKDKKRRDREDREKKSTENKKRVSFSKKNEILMKFTSVLKHRVRPV